ncbi:AraC family transcriptional regulator [Aquimarina sp. BL5]|uniref:helix-turn-helix domain-containing protein n=1 Tax=Aquimarina sp. BL5 TaxID=1714860 RepID=UPI000E4A4C41|nr:helix-turn-helix domain-containing protein [Aquimarina sp. BL5]AXT51680.1 AraC family transcriptional regulator [Aquimarina sp. BL5]RKN02308.1 helix-turn-helix domain-containing protein [Aquimarina sp. BL5]
MNSFGIIDLILFLGISQGIFLAITLQFLSNKNRSANFILSIILLISSIILIGRLYYFVFKESEFLARLGMVVDSSIYLFGPLLYLYVRRMVVSSKEKPVLRWVEFIPSGLHFIYVLWTFSLSRNEMLEMYYDGFFVIPYFIVEISIITVFTIYILKCFMLLRRFRLAEERVLSFHQEIYFYLIALVSVFSVLTFCWFLNLTITFGMGVYNLYFNYNVVWSCVPVIMYVVGFYSFKQPEIFRVPIFYPKKDLTRDRLGKDKIETLTSSLEHLLIVDKVYLNPNLTLRKLAAELKVSSNDLSWFLNKIHKCNFYEYINKYRLQEFIAKIQKGEHEQHTILALSFDSGFNSKSTFNKAFKTILEDTPSNYIKKMSSI